MKKALALVLAGSMLFGLASCTTDGANNESAPATTTAATAASGDSESVSDTVEPSSSDGEGAIEGASQATDELFNGALAIDDHFEIPDEFAWGSYIEGGKFTLVNEGGEMIAQIEEPGSQKHSCQVFRDGFAIYQGAEYQVDFDIRGDVERDFEWRIQMNGGDYHAYFLVESEHMTTETTHITAVFTMYEASDPAPRFAFNLGSQGDCDGVAHNVYIDNVVLTVLNSENAIEIEPLPEPNHVNVNQVGYQPDDAKTVFVAESEDTSFEIIDADSLETVYEGTLGDTQNARGAGMNVRAGDFSDFTTPGTYYIHTEEAGDSYNFVIGDGVYDDVFNATVQMLYLQRCGCEVDEAIAGAYAHPECHMDMAQVYGTDAMIDVSGGWHDAGDYGRYVVSGAKTVADLLLAYQDAGCTSDAIGIPESGNGVPDVLDEARYELEWMFKMQAENGGVYHKVTCANFPDTVMPEEEVSPLLVLPISTTATGDFAAVMAMASVIYRTYDSAFADQCLEAAKNAYAYMEQNAANDLTGFINPEDVVTGEYPDACNTDEFFWAAIELYIATSDTAYLDKAKELYTSDMNMGLGWADVAFYGIYSYLLVDSPADTAFADELSARVIDKVDLDLIIANREGFYSAMGMSYPWGSNMSVSNNGMMYYLAYLITGNEDYMNLAFYQVDYILGMNSCAYCFVTGFGTNSPMYPHHRPSQAVGSPVPGMVIGGPNGKPEDPYALSVLTGMKPARSYVDNDTAFSVNEITIYWNSPFIYILAAKMN